jgi:hypothetical protein
MSGRSEAAAWLLMTMGETGSTAVTPATNDDQADVYVGQHGSESREHPPRYG